MTQRERIIVSAYTGILMTDFAAVQKYVSEKLGRPVQTLEFSLHATNESIKNAVKQDFIALCGTDADAEVH